MDRRVTDRHTHPASEQIAQGLGIPDVDDLNKSDLIITVQKYLEENEATLTKDDRFKGLFVKRKRT
jgi:hypothetical protein